LCFSDLYRSFWLYAHHPTLFERACDFDHWEHHGAQAQQYDLGLKRQPFTQEPDWAVTSINLDLTELLARAMPPG
jgi:hypothetical protein